MLSVQSWSNRFGVWSQAPTNNRPCANYPVTSDPPPGLVPYPYVASPTESAPAFAGVLTGISGDLRHALRLLWKGKGLTATTLLTLALCIGATTAIFSTVYSLLLKPLPFNEPERRSSSSIRPP